MDLITSATSDSGNTAAKRKRSPSSASLPPTAPSSKKANHGTNAQLSINYLARHSIEDLALINKDNTLPGLLHLLSSYSNVLDRHESLASNLGARPLGPILIKRFERCFDSPPKVVASHQKGIVTEPSESHQTITWLEVIEFARSHPGQFTLGTFSEGVRVCQFYYPQKQLRVQISEEDFLFISSGRCQELIPPLPIWEDEEKEVATCDVLELKLKELTNAADAVAARTRQLGHRLKNRRAAILERRAEGGSATPAKAPPSAAAGFASVNFTGDKVNGDSGESYTMPNPALRNELLRHFEGLPQNHHHRTSSRTAVPELTTSFQHRLLAEFGDRDDTPVVAGRARSSTSSLSEVESGFMTEMNNYIANQVPNSHPTPPQQQRPSSKNANQHHTLNGSSAKHNFSRPLPPGQESTQPYRPLCQAHMDGLPKQARVLPPCDRCRRLRMDCVKNLTSCLGCTKKHARCHWKEVTRDEAAALENLTDAEASTRDPVTEHAPTKPTPYQNGFSRGLSEEESDDDDANPLEDLEALGAKEDDERETAVIERQRQDEEGLRNARELAKMGYEGGLKDGSMGPTDGRGAPLDKTTRLHSSLQTPVSSLVDSPTHLTSEGLGLTDQGRDQLSNFASNYSKLLLDSIEIQNKGRGDEIRRSPHHYNAAQAQTLGEDSEATNQTSSHNLANHDHHGTVAGDRATDLQTSSFATNGHVAASPSAGTNHAGFRALNATS